MMLGHNVVTHITTMVGVGNGGPRDAGEGSHPKCTFAKLEAIICKRYHKVQTDEQINMALKVIKQTSDEKGEVYNEHILKLANYLHHKANNNLFTTFFQVGLVPYLWVTTIGMKRNNLFFHKKVAMTCEKGIGDANEY